MVGSGVGEMTQLLRPSWKCEYLLLGSHNSNKREENKQTKTGHGGPSL